MPEYQIEYQAHRGDVPPYYPMQSYNKMTVPNRARNNGQDVDLTPIQFRRFVNMGYLDVQLHNGLRDGIATGKRIIIIPYFSTYIPRYHGMTKGDAGGFHKRGPSAYNVTDWMQSGPGSQPEHPGGPATLAGHTILNPMSG